MADHVLPTSSQSHEYVPRRNGLRAGLVTVVPFLGVLTLLTHCLPTRPSDIILTYLALGRKEVSVFGPPVIDLRKILCAIGVWVYIY